MTMSTSKRVAMYVLPVVVLSVALNIPKFMEATATVNENETITVEMAEMRREPTYVLYFTISQGRWIQSVDQRFNRIQYIGRVGGWTVHFKRSAPSSVREKLGKRKERGSRVVKMPQCTLQ